MLSGVIYSVSYHYVGRLAVIDSTVCCVGSVYFLDDSGSVHLVVDVIAGNIGSVHQWQEVWLIRGGRHVRFTVWHCASKISYQSCSEQCNQPRVWWGTVRFPQSELVACCCFSMLITIVWLQISGRIWFRLYVLMFCCINGTAPSYFAEITCPVADVVFRCHLHSIAMTTLIVTPIWRSTLGDRAFCVAAPWKQFAIICASCSVTYHLLMRTEDIPTPCELCRPLSLLYHLLQYLCKVPLQCIRNNFTLVDTF